MQASFGQDLTELPADELLVLTDDVFLFLYDRNHSRLRAWLDAGDQQPALSRVDRVLGSERLTGALLDPLTHHVHILEMNGESYRLKQSKHKRNPHPGR